MAKRASLEIEVAWGDMDAFGHVNNTVFFKYFESTRIAYMRSLETKGAGDTSFTPVVVSTRCDFLSPVVFPDTVVGETWVAKLGNSSLTMEYQLTSRAQNQVVAKGEAVLVNFDSATGRPRPIAEDLIARIETDTP